MLFRMESVFRVNEPTKVMFLPDGAAAPRPEPVFKRPRYPFLKTITTLVIVDTVLWVVTGMYWLLNWQAVFQ